MVKLAHKQRQLSFTCSNKKQKIIFNWSLRAAHSIHYINIEIYITSKSFTFTEKTTTTTTNAVLARFTLKDAEMLRLAIPPPCLILPQLHRSWFPLKTCFWDSFRTAISLGPAFQKIPIGNSFKPALSQHTETGQQMLQLASLRLTTFLNCLGPPKTNSISKINWKQL